MSHLSPSLSSLPPELKRVIARMARDQDELFRAPAYSLLPNASKSADYGLRRDLSSFQGSAESLYGYSLHMLAEVSRDWRDAASVYLNETMSARMICLLQWPSWRLAQPARSNLITAYDRVKHRVRRVTFPQFVERDDPFIHVPVLKAMANFPSVYEVSLDVGHYNSDDQEDRRPRTVAEAFLLAITAHHDVGKRITSLTIAFDSDIDEQPPTTQTTFANIITSLPSLIHLRVINPIQFFSSSSNEAALKTALEGAKHLTSLSLRLSPDYVNDDVEGLEEICMLRPWLSWKPRLKELDIVTYAFGNSLPSFIAGVAPTLEHLSLSYQHLANVYPLSSSPARPPFFDPTSFPSLTHLKLTGNENDFILESFVGSPISHPHLTSTSYTSCALLVHPSTLDQYQPTLRHLRLDSEPSRPRTLARGPS